jgi:hypothetical protein
MVVPGFNRSSFDSLHSVTHSIPCTLKFRPSVAAGPPWGSARELSLSPLTRRGDPPPPGPGEGDVTTPYSWSLAGTTVASLLRGTGGF